ncbi:hypothetical protein HMPREF3034_00301 [Prevotella sp. DNF00663]|uniref:DUF4296 domain-containing protein n=1 Tax=Prevotella sp. DNF00663 TaxID=1384078 RepID=UPI000798AC17|nr:DUF4296 domain-containing protein [Prevotella sp. DNF00663]KXB85120.1 hypothetical protein HMPREF3034_00301 [Prevotella sp. DNF00663]
MNIQNHNSIVHTAMSLRMFGLLVVLGLLVLSCKPTVPSSIIQPDEMEDILYDYHLAEGISASPGGDSKAFVTYREAVFKKHGITSAEFDSSMVYYLRHTESLEKIYESLSKRLSDESASLGGSQGSGAYGMLSENGDTANVWRGEQSMVLSMYEPFNLYTFTQAVDTAYHQGDRLVLDFDAQYIFQDGSRDAVAVLVVKYQNDSIVSQVVHISGGSHQSATVEDAGKLGIKEVKGYFMLNTRSNISSRSSTTLRLLLINNIRLIRMHVKAEPQVVSQDSTKVAGKTDTVPPTSSSMPDERPRRVPPVRVPMGGVH